MLVSRYGPMARLHNSKPVRAASVGRKYRDVSDQKEEGAKRCDRCGQLAIRGSGKCVKNGRIFLYSLSTDARHVGVVLHRCLAKETPHKE